MAQPSFIFPDSSFNTTVSIQDQLDITYTTPWPSVNLTVFCPASATAVNDYLVWVAYNNPILANGTYILPHISNTNFGQSITQYPVQCHALIQNSENGKQNLNGAIFNLTSTAGAAKTWQMSQTSGATSFPTQSASQTGSAGTTTATATATSSAATSSSTSDHQHKGLSDGAKAGIGIGVAVGVVTLLILVGFLFWSYYGKKRKGRMVAGAYQPPTEFGPDKKPLRYSSKVELSGNNQKLPPQEMPSKSNRPQELMSTDHTSPTTQNPPLPELP